MSIENGEAKKENLFDYTEEQLLEENVLTHYQILGIEEHTSTDHVKKAYRKASLKYHPDKTGRGDDDYVFLAVKKAYDILSDHTKRSAYDSTALPFDDSIPPSRYQLLQDTSLLYKDEDFYSLFGPVFQRNLRFDANLRPDAPGIVKKNKNNTNRNNNAGGGAGGKGFQPPTLGNDDAPILEVHKFYEYWIHFESWRDFTAQATDELQVDNEIENAESRYEKRWLQKEVDKRAKQLKTKENGRIQTLVERAMEADPRLRRERQAIQEAKEQAKADKVAMAEKKKLQEEQAKLQAEQQAEEEKQRRAEEKVAREQEKKLIRKARQQLRRMTSSSFEEASSVSVTVTAPASENSTTTTATTTTTTTLPTVWADSYDMSLDVDYLCTNLTLDELKQLNEEYSGILSNKNDDNDKSNNNDNGARNSSSDGGDEGDVATATAALTMIRERAMQERSSGGKRQSTTTTTQKNTDQNSSSTTTQTTTPDGVANKKLLSQPPSTSKSKKHHPWTKDELSALAKAVKKYPPGGASRWDQISLFVNNLCKQHDPRSREECIHKYNDITKSASVPTTTTTATTTSTKPATTSTSTTTDAAAAKQPSKITTSNGDSRHEGGTDTTPSGTVVTPSTTSDGGTATTTTTTTTRDGGNDKNNNNNTADDVWTPEQDQQLQDALAKYPASMEKNARWTAIAEAIPGKTKKVCVQRFKVIRDALLKNRK